MLAPTTYHDPEHFDREVDRIFGRGWIFAALADQVARPNDFVTLRVGRRPVVVQNYDGELRAFLNVCSHRSSILQVDRAGNRPLRCPYHGWAYNREGVPSGVPANKECFGLTAEDRQALALPRFTVQSCGKFVFIKADDAAPTLAEWLGPLGPILEDLSGAMLDPFQTQAVPWHCNWKVGIENAIESYHVTLVHEKTLVPAVTPDWTSADLPPAGSTHAVRLTDRILNYWNYGIFRLQMEGCHAYDETFTHFLVYPNLLVGITHGVQLIIQVFEPVAPDRSLSHHYLYLASPIPESEEEEDAEFREGMRAAIRKVTHELLEEDRLVSEGVQRGISHAVHRARYGASEARIVTFHDWLSRSLEGA